MLTSPFIFNENSKEIKDRLSSHIETEIIHTDNGRISKPQL
jgi:hypothetical protein